jgi:hypothetical protein
MEDRVLGHNLESGPPKTTIDPIGLFRSMVSE